MSSTAHTMNDLVENDHRALLKALADLDTAFSELPEMSGFNQWKLGSSSARFGAFIMGCLKSYIRSSGT